MIKVSTQEGNKTVINIYTLIIGAPKYTEQILTDIEEEIDSHTIIVGDFKLHLHQ